MKINDRLANANESQYDGGMLNPSPSFLNAAPLPQVAADGAADSVVRGAAVPRVSSRVLMGGAREIEIDHEGVVYRLRVTSLGKLILTK